MSEQFEPVRVDIESSAGQRIGAVYMNEPAPDWLQLAEFPTIDFSLEAAPENISVRVFNLRIERRWYNGTYGQPCSLVAVSPDKRTDEALRAIV